MRKPTARQIAASRANGARSKGPVTAAGKQRVSINATRHGLLARATVLRNESTESFMALLQHHVDKLNPIDDAEHNCVEEMAGTDWRLRRLWAIETRLLDLAIDQRRQISPFDPSDPNPNDTELTRLAEAFRDLADTPSFRMIDRYTTHLSRMYQRALDNFFLFRLERTDPEPSGSEPVPDRETNPAVDNPLPVPKVTAEPAPENPAIAAIEKRPESPKPANKPTTPSAPNVRQWPASPDHPSPFIATVILPKNHFSR